MKVIPIKDILLTQREVHCPNKAFVSYRFLLAKDGMGFSLHKTLVRAGGPYRWHYKHHLEACYCVEGTGILKNIITGEEYIIKPDTCYALDAHDPHEFTALNDTILISVFNPPVTGGETHLADGSYASGHGEYYV